MATYGGGSGKMGKMLEVKNKTAAPIQISAEQLLREAVDRQAHEVTAPRQRIADDEELQEYRVRKRKEFEDTLRRQRQHIGTWIKYAQWEAAQKEFRRARSIFERALSVDYQNNALWLKYIEMEMKNKFVNSARNLYDRVTQLLPRIDQFWFKYAHMEEILGNYAGTRAVFERWMEWEPEEKGWMLYVHFEERCGEMDLARKVYERFLSCRPATAAFVRYAKFEERARNFVRARAAFEKAVEVMPQEALEESFYVKFAQFEQRRGEHERAKVIYQQALALLPKGKSDELWATFVSFQKQHGTRAELEDTVLCKRRFVYEEEVKLNPTNYDSWFDYIRLEEECGDIERIRDIYERAVANIPPVSKKRYWKRYIFIWINYALFEELVTGDIERCRAVHSAALNIVPHRSFSFAKLWHYAAEFEVRQLQLERARKIFGRAIAECGKPKIFTAYAGLELRLGNIDRCRTIFAKFIEAHPANPKAWISLIELEITAEEIDRARAVCEIAVEIEQMDFPELIWKAYIDLETDLPDIERARALYERLLAKTQHFKVFQSYSQFEWSNGESIEKAREIIKKGLEVCKESDLQEERALLLEHWLQIERENGDEKMIQSVWGKRPKRVKRKRNVVGEDGDAQGWEEYTGYIFPEDTQQDSNLKILEAAKKWKRQKVAGVQQQPV